MSRHSASDSSGSDSDTGSRGSDRRASKKSRRDDKERKSSKSSSKDSKRHKSSKSSKKDSKKKHSSKSHKSDRKHSKSHKSDRKRKRSRSRSASSTDESDSESSGSSRSPSPKQRRDSASAASSSSSSKSAPAIPPPSESSVARCLDLISTLLQHGGGDRAESLQQLQFMLFKLDAGSAVDVEAIPDPLVKHILNTMLREAGCRVRRDPSTNEQGWMVPVDHKGRPAYKLLTVLDEAFNPKKAAAAATAAAAPVPIGPAMPPPSVSIGPSMPPPATATAASAPRTLGPTMPQAEDFERLAQGGGADAPAAATAASYLDDDGDDDAGNFGPKMPSQMSAGELAAFARLRASREHLAAVKAMGKEGPKDGSSGREEWMTSLPAADPNGGMPSASFMVALAASGDRESMKSRGFSSKGVKVVEQDDSWTLSPEEKARKDAEKVAIRQAEQAVYNSTRAINGDMGDIMGGGRGRQSANASAAAAQAANDRMMARYKQQHTATAESLMGAHARAAEAAAKSAKESSDGLFRWDHAKEMGMRAVKGSSALKKEMQSAFSLSDNFAPAGS